MKRKFLATFLAFALSISLITPAFAEEPTSGGEVSVEASAEYSI